VDIVGVEDKAHDIANLLEKTNIVGIVGMGGIGKTTLANVVHDHLSCKFDATYSIKNLRNGGDDEVMKGIINELLQQCKVSYDFMDLGDGQAKVKETLKLKKVLVIMDDVQKKSQILSLMKLTLVDNTTTNKIIVTTRDRTLLEGCEKEMQIYSIDCLHKVDAKELFYRHAFRNQNACSPHLEEVAEKIIDCCKGLPLSLKVTGSCLYEQDRVRVWEQTLRRLQKARPLDGDGQDEDLWKRLKISFDGLQSLDKRNMFLDICFFFCKSIFLPKGMSLYEAIYISQFNIEDFKALEEKSLVQTNYLDDVIQIHDQLRDMGRMIVEKDNEFCGTRFLNSNAINVYIQKVLDSHAVKLLVLLLCMTLCNARLNSLIKTEYISC
jgi:hypothetical protein